MIRWSAGYAPNPWWKWHRTRRIASALGPVLRRLYPIDVDGQPPRDFGQMADWLIRWRLAPEGVGPTELAQELARLSGVITTESWPTSPQPTQPEPGRVVLCAEFEPVSEVLITWPIWYPGLWSFHTELTRAIAQSAPVTVLVPSPFFASAAALALGAHRRVTFAIYPADDIWIRDCGPMMARSATGDPIAVDAIYDPPPSMPFAADDVSGLSWAATRGCRSVHLPLHFEGGNLWTDGEGTIVTSAAALARNGGHDRFCQVLSQTVDIHRLHVLPPVPNEATGHVDMITKPLRADLWAWSRFDHPNDPTYRTRLEHAVRSLRTGSGKAIELLALPAPRPTVNLGLVHVWPSYCNNLTVNDALIVPIFGAPEDDVALALLRDAAPNLEIRPIDARRAANGGGTIHCMTMQIHAASSVASAVSGNVCAVDQLP